jgi:hypothetical protein
LAAEQAILRQKPGGGVSGKASGAGEQARLLS